MPSAEQCVGGLRYVSFLIALSREAAIEISPASSAAECREREEKGTTSPGRTIESLSPWVFASNAIGRTMRQWIALHVISDRAQPRSGD
jgi:hypothetical protein